MRIQLTLYIYLNNIGRWCFFALTFVYKWLDYAKISKLKCVLPVWSIPFIIIVLLFIWNARYWYILQVWVWRLRSPSEVPDTYGYHVCVYTIICLLCLCCERPFVHFTGMNINCNWLMWALCVGMRHIQCVSDWNATMPDIRMLCAV